MLQLAQLGDVAALNFPLVQLRRDPLDLLLGAAETRGFFVDGVAAAARPRHVHRSELRVGHLHGRLVEVVLFGVDDHVLRELDGLVGEARELDELLFVVAAAAAAAVSLVWHQDPSVNDSTNAWLNMNESKNESINGSMNQ